MKVGERRLTFFFSTFQTRSWFVMRTGEKKGCQQADDWTMSNANAPGCHDFFLEGAQDEGRVSG